VAARQVTFSAQAKEWGSRDLSAEGVSDLESGGVGAPCVERVLGTSRSCWREPAVYGRRDRRCLWPDYSARA